MKVVIGFEGTWPTESAVAWGAAALEDESNLINSFTGHSGPLSEKDALVRSGFLTLLPDSVELRPEHIDLPLIVLALRKANEEFKYLVPDMGRLGGIVGTKRRKVANYYVFRDRIAFDQYANDIAETITGAVLRSDLPAAIARGVVNAGLILTPGSPYLHALRAFYSPSNRDRAAAVGRAALTEAASQHKFDQLFTALTLAPGSESHYWLKYEDGIAEGGGLDADSAQEQFSALAKLHRKIRPLLIKANPFFESEDEIPFPRVLEMKAASASIGFGVALQNRPTFERVARYFELQMFQEIVRGNIPSELSNDPEFGEALSQLLSPSPDTQVSQRPFGQDQSEAVAFMPAFETGNASADARLSVFGVVEGISGEARRAELRIFPSIRESVSTTDNGYDEAPNGSDVFHRGNDFLFRPAVFTLSRFVDLNRRHRFFLQSFRILGTGESAEIDAIPSSVVHDAFVKPRTPLRLSLGTNGTIYVSGGEVARQSIHSMPAARRMLAEFGEWATNFELSIAKSAQCDWIKPIDPRSPRALYRFLISLDAMGGNGVVTDIIADLNRRFDALVRRNNTYREIAANQDLIAVDEVEDDKVELTEKGRLLVDIYKAAGGFAGNPEVPPTSSLTRGI